MEACSAGALPRGRQQIIDCRKGKLPAVCPYVNVQTNVHDAAPYTMVVLVSEYTLNVLLRFCTNPEAFSISILYYYKIIIVCDFDHILGKYVN